MKPYLKTTLAATALTCIAAVSASASTLLKYDLSGDYTGSFQIEQMPTPDGFDTTGFWVIDVFDGSGSVLFFTSSVGGGFYFSDGATFGDFSGALLFEGNTSAPVMLTGTFDLFAPGSSASPDLTVVVTEVTTSVIPLPAAGWMLLAGVAGLGALRGRRKAA